MKAQSNLVPISGGFHVWTRRVGESPIKVHVVQITGNEIKRDGRGL